jgi:hypothetical protein
VSDNIAVSEQGTVVWELGGSFNTGFDLADRYYAQLIYGHQISARWQWQARYNYQLQPEHNNQLQFDVIYRF